MAHTLGTILLGWRKNTGLDQAALSAITYEVAEMLREAGEHEITGIMRQHIGRLENDQVKEPESRTLRVMAYALSEALRRQDRDAVDGEALYQTLLVHSRKRITVADVSPYAAELDAIMAIVSEPSKTIMYAGLIASARAQIDKSIEMHKARKSATQGNDNSG